MIFLVGLEKIDGIGLIYYLIYRLLFYREHYRLQKCTKYTLQCLEILQKIKYRIVEVKCCDKADNILLISAKFEKTMEWRLTQRKNSGAFSGLRSRAG